jgi:hypothetical protein
MPPGAGSPPDGLPKVTTIRFLGTSSIRCRSLGVHEVSSMRQPSVGLIGVIVQPVHRHPLFSHSGERGRRPKPDRQYRNHHPRIHQRVEVEDVPFEDGMELPEFRADGRPWPERTKPRLSALSCGA